MKSTVEQEVDKEIRGVLDDAFSKYRRGEEKHGVLDIDRDSRNFLKEAEDELLDAMVYCAAEILRLRRLNAKLDVRMKRAIEIATLLENNGTVGVDLGHGQVGHWSLYRRSVPGVDDPLAVRPLIPADEEERTL